MEELLFSEFDVQKLISVSRLKKAHLPGVFNTCVEHDLVFSFRMTRRVL